MKSIYKIKFFRKNLSGESSGFTLMEVMIAMAIFAIGILGVATMQISSTNGNASARRHSEASEIAQGQIESLMAMPYTSIVIGTTNTTTNGYAVQLVGTQVLATGVEIGRQVQVVVTDPQGKPGSTLSFIRYNGI